MSGLKDFVECNSTVTLSVLELIEQGFTPLKITIQFFGNHPTSVVNVSPACFYSLLSSRVPDVECAEDIYSAVDSTDIGDSDAIFTVCDNRGVLFVCRDKKANFDKFVADEVSEFDKFVKRLR